MHKHTIALVGAALLAGLPACVNLDEDVVTGLTPGTDIFTKGADGSYKYINDYTTQLNPTAQYVQDTWVDFYRAINTTNAAIDQAPVVVMDSALKARRVAEDRFLRALYYFDLLQLFMPVTLTFHVITCPTPDPTRARGDSLYD